MFRKGISAFVRILVQSFGELLKGLEPISKALMNVDNVLANKRQVDDRCQADSICDMPLSRGGRAPNWVARCLVPFLQ